MEEKIVQYQRAAREVFKEAEIVPKTGDAIKNCNLL
jgi:hypothetical protein